MVDLGAVGDDLSFARRARDLLERPGLDTSSAPFKQQVVWHDVLFRALLVHVEWDLKHEMREDVDHLLSAPVFLSPSQRCWLHSCLRSAKRVDVVLLDSARGLTADRVHVNVSSRFVGSYDQLQGIQADPNRLYVAYTQGRLATTLWMEQEPLGLPSDAEVCWTDWLPEFENHPDKKLLSPSHQQWIEFAAKRHALLSRGEVEPAATGSAHGAPSHSDWNMSSAHQMITWRALVGTTREHFGTAVGLAWNCQIERRLMRKVDKACEEAQKKVLSTSTSASSASIVEKVVLQGPTQMVREVGIGRWLQQNPLPSKQSVNPAKAEWLQKAIKFAMLVPNAVAISLGDKGRVQLSVPYADLPDLVPHCQPDGNALDDDVVGFGATMWILHGMWLERTAESESLSNSSQDREEGLNFEILRHKAELKEGDAWFQKSCESGRFAVAHTDPQKGKKGHKRLYLYRGGGSLDELATPLMGGLVVRSVTQVFAAMVLVTLHVLSGCSPAFEELVGFVKECLVVEEDLYVDPEATEDVEDAELFAKEFKETGDRHCRKFQALYEGILADVRNCLESWAGRKWPAHRPFDIGEARSKEAFLHAALADKLSHH